MRSASSMLLTTMLLGMMVPAQAAASAHAGHPSHTEGCHALMTAQECSAFIHTLAGLQQGTERERFLQAHLETKRDRELACNSKATFMPVTYYPRNKQAVLGQGVAP